MLREFFLGAQRKAHTLNKNVTGTVPLQHSFSEGTRPIENLPVVRKCLGYIADTINETRPQIVDRKGKVITDSPDLPRWIRQPSGEFVLEELNQQAVWSLFVEGNLYLLANVTSKRVPAQMYVGTGAHETIRDSGGGVVYKDYSPGNSSAGTIIANQITHRRRLSVPGQSRGIGEFGPARALLNSALHAQDLVVKFFASNMHLDLIFTHEGDYVKDAGHELLTQLAKKHAGGANAFRPIVTDRKFKIDRLKDSNQANQLVELMNLIDSKITTTVFGIDPLVFSLSSGAGPSLTYQNSSNLRSQVWLQAVKPIARLIEGCISDYLPMGQYFKFSAEDLLRGSPSDRANLMSLMSLSGKHNHGVTHPIFSIAEQREVLGYSPDEPEPVADPMAEIEAEFAKLDPAKQGTMQP